MVKGINKTTKSKPQPKPKPKNNPKRKTKSSSEPRSQESNTQNNRVEKGRPVAEQEVNHKKVEVLMENPLFYHHHRVTLISTILAEYHKNPNATVHDYIGKKEMGTVSHKPLLEILQGDQQSPKGKLKSMLETALTMKNFDLRPNWQRIYLQVCKLIISSKTEEVNSKSKMQSWGQALACKLQTPELQRLINLVRIMFPQSSNVQGMIVNEAYCMMARYHHFEVNICPKNNSEGSSSNSEKDEEASKEESPA